MMRMAKSKNPNGIGSYCKLKDGRYKWKQMVDGDTRQITARSPKELQEKVKRIVDLPIIKDKLKATDWFEKWLETYVKPLRKPATYDQYKIIYETHIKASLGNKRLANIKQYDIQQIIAEMNEKDLSTWTMKHARKIMNLAFSKAFDDKLIPENPVRKIEIPKKQAKPRKTIKTDELKIFFEHAKNTRWYWTFKFLLVTGLRRGELLALRWSDIDSENKRIVVDESNSSGGVGDTKSAKVHYVPLSELAKYYLQKQKEMLIDEKNPALYNDALSKQDLIFPSKQGTMMKPDSFNSVLDRINKKANIHITPHMFRHTFVFMSKGKMTLSELQEALGHDESTTTLDIYGTMLADTSSVANKIDEVFASLDKGLGEEAQKEDCKVINLFQRRKIK